jgi:phosphonoacetate hydrolase
MNSSTRSIRYVPLLIGLVSCVDESEHPATTPQCTLPVAVLGEPIPEEWGGGSDTERSEAISLALVQDDSVAFVAWPDEASARYQVRTSQGLSAFSRERSDEGQVIVWEGAGPPLEQDSSAVATYEEELASGSNPFGTTYPEHGYGQDDERLAFVDSDAGVYPLLGERIAQVFDARHRPDMVWSTSAAAGNGLGSHGGMSLAQSRAPLLMHGPGLVASLVEHPLVRVVDLAPTVAALLGVAPVSGIARGHEATELMLKWQDGRVLSELFSSECSYGAAERAVVIILDGLAHTELERALADEALPTIGRLAAGGLRLQYGSLVGFPSFSLPGHVSVHTGAYPGHHGLVSNEFIDRSTGEPALGVALQELLIDPVEAQRVSAAYLEPGVETLFEAVSRSFPDAVTASVNELTIRGADYCRLNEASRAAEDYTEYELGDELAVFDFNVMWERTGAPKYLALSFYLTDAAGEGSGPHGDALQQALVDTDERLGRIFERYDEEGLFESTLFVLTADHGMELQDTSRSGEPKAAVLAASPEALLPSRGLIYSVD